MDIDTHKDDQQLRPLGGPSSVAVEAVDTRSESIPPSANKENVLFCDPDGHLGGVMFHGETPHVMVTSDRLKISSDSHLLSGVRNVELLTYCRRLSVTSLLKCIALWSLAFLVLCIGISVLWSADGSQLSKVVGTIVWFFVLAVVVVFAEGATTDDRNERFWKAVLVLNDGRSDNHLPIAYFKASDAKTHNLRRFEKRKRIQEDKARFDQNVVRIKAISEAVGQAIQGVR